MILKKLNELNYGDYLIYSDAGTVYVNNVSYLAKALDDEKQDILFSASAFIEKQWSKRDAFELMDVDYETYKDTFQSEATFVFIRKSDSSLNFVRTWLSYCCDERIITDKENTTGKPNAENFISNRHDQTVYSLLGKKMGYKQFKGISDSSELYKFLSYADGELFGLSRDELIENALRHRNSDIYLRGSYPRIFVNTRLKNDTWLKFLRRLLIKVRINVIRDKNGRRVEEEYLKKIREEF